MIRELRKAVKCGPRWFAEMRRMSMVHRSKPVRDASIESIAEQLDELEKWLDTHELTFAIAGGVSQCLQALGTVLPRWLGDDWRSLLNAALQGQGSVISAQQIVRLAELVQAARQESKAFQALTDETAMLMQFRHSLKGTNFLRAFDLYLDNYGHR